MPRPLPASIVAHTGGHLDAVRAHILDATHRVIATHGLAGASTRAIAAEAGLGAGTLYNYFDDRLQLVARSIVRRAVVLAESLDDLPARAGRDTVRENLRFVMRHAATVMDELVPLLAAAFSDPELLAAFRHEIATQHPSLDPGLPVERYLEAERDLGRISPNANCRAAASLLVSLTHDRAFHRFLRGTAARAKTPVDEIDLITRALEEGQTLH